MTTPFNAIAPKSYVYTYQYCYCIEGSGVSLFEMVVLDVANELDEWGRLDVE